MQQKQKINIGPSRCAGNKNLSEIEGNIKTHDDLMNFFYTEVLIENSTGQFLYVVDSFRLLYELIYKLTVISVEKELYIDIGEGCFFELRHQSVESIIVKVVAEDNIKLIEDWQISLPEVIYLLTKMICNLSSSLENIGVDVNQYINKFKPAMF